MWGQWPGARGSCWGGWRGRRPRSRAGRKGHAASLALRDLAARGARPRGSATEREPSPAPGSCGTGGCAPVRQTTPGWRSLGPPYRGRSTGPNAWESAAAIPGGDPRILGRSASVPQVRVSSWTPAVQVEGKHQLYALRLPSAVLVPHALRWSHGGERRRLSRAMRDQALTECAASAGAGARLSPRRSPGAGRGRRPIPVGKHRTWRSFRAPATPGRTPCRSRRFRRLNS